LSTSGRPERAERVEGHPHRHLSAFSSLSTSRRFGTARDRAKSMFQRLAEVGRPSADMPRSAEVHLHQVLAPSCSHHRHPSAPCTRWSGSARDRIVSSPLKRRRRDGQIPRAWHDSGAPRRRRWLLAWARRPSTVEKCRRDS
jgi:hypothetical protein